MSVYQSGTRHPKFRDISGMRFGRLVAVSCTGAEQGVGPLWKCRCDCGGTVDVPSRSLLKGQKKSCGCLYRENIETLKMLGRKAEADRLVKRQTLQTLRYWFNCKHCGRTKYTERGAIWCSSRCRGLYQFMRLTFCPEHRAADEFGTVKTAVLVWEKATGDKLFDGDRIHYKDGNPTNIGIDNLQLIPRAKRVLRCEHCGNEYGTSLSRIKHSRNFCSFKCSKHARRSLPEETVIDARIAYASGERCIDIARRTGVRDSTIHQIVKNVTYLDIPFQKESQSAEDFIVEATDYRTRKLHEGKHGECVDERQGDLRAVV